MACDRNREFDVLYTHQKTKKSKCWQDGLLRVSSLGTRAILFDDKSSKLDTLYVKPDQVSVGQELESDRYLVTIENEKIIEGTRNGNESTNAVPQLPPKQLHPVQQDSSHNRIRVMLKRKRSGFTVPRHVSKKLAPDNADVVTTATESYPLSANNQQERIQPFVLGPKSSLFSTSFKSGGDRDGIRADVFAVCDGFEKAMPQSKHLEGEMAVNCRDVQASDTESRLCNSPSRQENFCTTVISEINDSISVSPPCYDVDTPKTLSGMASTPCLGNTYHKRVAVETDVLADEVRSKTQDKQSSHLLNLSDQRSEQETFLNFEAQKENIFNASCDVLKSFPISKQQSIEESQISIHEGSQDHTTNMKESIPEGRRSASQILALLGKGKARFKPPVKQSEPKYDVAEGISSSNHRGELTSSCKQATTEPLPSESTSSLVFDDDVDVMTLLGQAKEDLTDVSHTHLPSEPCHAHTARMYTDGTDDTQSPVAGPEIVAEQKVRNINDTPITVERAQHIEKESNFNIVERDSQDQVEDVATCTLNKLSDSKEQEDTVCLEQGVQIDMNKKDRIREHRKLNDRNLERRKQDKILQSMSLSNKDHSDANIENRNQGNRCKTEKEQDGEQKKNPCKYLTYSDQDVGTLGDKTQVCRDQGDRNQDYNTVDDVELVDDRNRDDSNTNGRHQEDTDEDGGKRNDTIRDGWKEVEGVHACGDQDDRNPNDNNLHERKQEDAKDNYVKQDSDGVHACGDQDDGNKNANNLHEIKQKDAKDNYMYIKQDLEGVQACGDQDDLNEEGTNENDIKQNLNVKKQDQWNQDGENQANMGEDDRKQNDNILAGKDTTKDYRNLDDRDRDEWLQDDRNQVNGGEDDRNKDDKIQGDGNQGEESMDSDQNFRKQDGRCKDDGRVESLDERNLSDNNQHDSELVEGSQNDRSQDSRNQDDGILCQRNQDVEIQEVFKQDELMTCSLCSALLRNLSAHGICQECTSQIAVEFESSWKSETEITFSLKEPDPRHNPTFASDDNGKFEGPLEKADISERDTCDPAEYNEQGITMRKDSKQVEVSSLKTKLGAEEETPPVNESQMLSDRSGDHPRFTEEKPAINDQEISLTSSHIFEFPPCIENRSAKEERDGKSLSCNENFIEDWLRNVEPFTSPEADDNSDSVVPQVGDILPKIKCDLRECFQVLDQESKPDENKGNTHDPSHQHVHQTIEDCSAGEQCVPVQPERDEEDSPSSLPQEKCDSPSEEERLARTTSSSLLSPDTSYTSQGTTEHLMRASQMPKLYSANSIDTRSIQGPPSGICSDVHYLPVKWKGVARRCKNTTSAHKEEVCAVGLSHTIPTHMQSSTVSNNQIKMPGVFHEHSEDHIDVPQERADMVFCPEPCRWQDGTQVRQCDGYSASLGYLKSSRWTRAISEEVPGDTSDVLGKWKEIKQNDASELAHQNHDEVRFESPKFQSPFSERSNRLPSQSILSDGWSESHRTRKGWNSHGAEIQERKPAWMEATRRCDEGRDNLRQRSPSTPLVQQLSPRYWPMFPCYNQQYSELDGSNYKELEVSALTDGDALECLGTEARRSDHNSNMQEKFCQGDSFSQEPFYRQQPERDIEKRWAPGGWVGTTSGSFSLPRPSQLKRNISDDINTCEADTVRPSEKGTKNKKKKDNYWNNPVSSGTVRRDMYSPTIFQARARRDPLSLSGQISSQVSCHPLQGDEQLNCSQLQQDESPCYHPWSVLDNEHHPQMLSFQSGATDSVTDVVQSGPPLGHESLYPHHAINDDDYESSTRDASRLFYLYSSSAKQRETVKSLSDDVQDFPRSHQGLQILHPSQIVNDDDDSGSSYKDACLGTQWPLHPRYSNDIPEALGHHHQPPMMSSDARFSGQHQTQPEQNLRLSSMNHPFQFSLGNASQFSEDCLDSDEESQIRVINPLMARATRKDTPRTQEAALSHCFPTSTVSRSKNLCFQNPVTSVTAQSLLPSGRSICGELFFPSAEDVQGVASLKRQVQIPVSFSSVALYKQVFTLALKEHLNVILFELSQRYHSAKDKADVQYLDSSVQQSGDCPQLNNSPQCDHGNPAKMVCVKKEGQNQGRFFYACSAPRANQCKFFLWADQFKGNSSTAKPSSGSTRPSLTNPTSATMYFKSHNVHLYYGCEFQQRAHGYDRLMPGAPAWIRKHRQQQRLESATTKKKLYLRLSRKEASSVYGKDDIWVISKDLTFDSRSTFLAKSVYHGPSSNNDVEIEPLSGFSTSNWTSTCTVHALLACNASSELTCLSNIQEYVDSRSVPILQSILINSSEVPSAVQSRPSAFKAPAQAQINLRTLACSEQDIEQIAADLIDRYRLNTDQATALRKVASMFQASRDKSMSEPITLIHGVFGAGKSFLISVTVLFLIKLFELNDAQNPCLDQQLPWKLLIASTTNVAVDRILLGLLELGFEDFIRVGSIKKIAKPVLPYSVHASDRKDSQEIRELYGMLKTDLTPCEKHHVKKSIERQRLGKNRDLLGRVRVVGVTCAACTFQCMSTLKFPVLLLDECSQMTEPSSLLPMARFQCEKLVLVGDPKQLDPTIQGSESGHRSGLEQTLFNRLIRLGCNPILLRTQYRCHPKISAISNSLFYEQQITDGVSAGDRPPLAPSLPTLCFYGVSNGKECCARDGSYYNDREAAFVVFLIETLVLHGVEPANIGVITLYKAQTFKINALLQESRLSTQSILKAIQVSTVDAFQGGEKGAIILSCVRTDYMGFADSDKRTNVALTRSKNHLFIVGNLRILSANNLWGKVIDKCKEADNGIQSSQAFVKTWTPRLEEILQDQMKKNKSRNLRGSQASKETQDPSARSKEIENATATRHIQEDLSPDVSQATPGTCHPQHLSTHGLSHTPVMEDSTPVMEVNLERSQARASTPRTSSPSYSPLSAVEESDRDASLNEDLLPCFNIGSFEDIVD